jgi:hypothetical protein
LSIVTTRAAITKAIFFVIVSNYFYSFSLFHVSAPKEGKPREENNIKVKVKFSLEQAMKAQRGSRGIALLFL